MARIMEASTNGEEGQLGSIRCQDLKYEEDTRQEDRGGLRAEDLNRSDSCPFPSFDNTNFNRVYFTIQETIKILISWEVKITKVLQS